MHSCSTRSQAQTFPGNDSAVEDRFDRLGDKRNIRHAIDAANKAACFIDRQDRRGLGTIFGHARADGFFIVVRAPLEFG